jgi:hypothetical protein
MIEALRRSLALRLALYVAIIIAGFLFSEVVVRLLIQLA